MKIDISRDEAVAILKALQVVDKFGIWAVALVKRIAEQVEKDDNINKSEQEKNNA